MRPKRALVCKGKKKINEISIKIISNSREMRLTYVIVVNVCVMK